MNLRFSRRNLIAVVATVAILSLAAAAGAPAHAADREAADFIEALGQRGVDVLQDEQGSTSAVREAAFRDILVEEFHIKTISRFVLGRYWKIATDQQRAMYKDVFVDFFVRIYAERFEFGNRGAFEVLEVVDGHNKKDAIVRTRIMRPTGGAPLHVDYRVRRVDGAYKVIDVNVEGISMLHTHRMEFASVINRKGIDGLLEDLRDRLNKPVETAMN